MLDIRQKEEICCSWHYTESGSNPFLSLCRKRVYLELGYVIGVREIVVLVVCKCSVFTLSVK